MKLLFSVLLLLAQVWAAGQTDSTKAHNATALKRGIYKTYWEFLDNAPSITDSFRVIELTRNKADSTVMEADYKFLHGAKAASLRWGFCDGTNVYVRFASAVFRRSSGGWPARALFPIYMCTINPYMPAFLPSAWRKPSSSRFRPVS